MVSLVVNDSFVNSDPDNVIIIAVNLSNEVVNSLNAVVVIVNCMEPEQFKNRKMAKPLTNKILAVIEQVELEVYQGAIEKLENDVMPKMDGYLNGSPDKNDWIVVYSDSCGAFQMMSELTKNAHDTLKTVINNMK